MNTLSFILLTIALALSIKLLFNIVTFLLHWEIKRILLNAILIVICLFIFLRLNEQYAINEYKVILLDYFNLLIAYLKELVIFVKSLIEK